MKEEIHHTFEKVVQAATEEDLIVLQQMLNGLSNKQAGNERTYFKDLFLMEADFDGEECEVDIPVTPLLYNNFSIVHGGVTATLLDTAMGVMANNLLPAGQQAVTSNLTIHYIAPGTGSRLKAKAKVIHRGTQTMVLEGTAFRDDGTKIAHCTGSFFILK
ncbi:PaaI family thioesterase [Heyndrickxia coagulans]|uniref:PaaI family thioesterase n=1 Tax=Heyndrickxia coagulans TaxID=1398 RepID=UPI002811C3DB|nr:PaaI family thioesterase [Heyndrickxia coagulans]WMM89870.1 PaaI family thioesterase [Heyndrickxia coagulans]